MRLPGNTTDEPSDILAWQDAFLAGGEPSLKSNPRDELQEKDNKIEKLHRKIGEMTMELEILSKANDIYKRDLDCGASRKMRSPATTWSLSHLESSAGGSCVPHVEISQAACVAREKISEWVRFYNEERPHQSLNCLSPNEFRAHFQNTSKVA